jgi:hypothetical protein
MKSLTITQTLFDDFVVMSEQGCRSITGQEKLREFLDDYFDVDLVAPCKHTEDIDFIQDSLDEIISRFTDLKRSLLNDPRPSNPQVSLDKV